jgi:hypothetical protein
MLRAINAIIARLRAEIEAAPDTDYRRGALDVLATLEGDIYEELGEEE